jgi:hypothetical protein
MQEVAKIISMRLVSNQLTTLDRERGGQRVCLLCVST